MMVKIVVPTLGSFDVSTLVVTAVLCSQEIRRSGV